MHSIIFRDFVHQKTYKCIFNAFNAEIHPHKCYKGTFNQFSILIKPSDAPLHLWGWSYSQDAHVSGGMVKLAKDISFSVNSICVACFCFMTESCFPKNNGHTSIQSTGYCFQFNSLNVAARFLWDHKQHQHRSDLRIISSQISFFFS